MKIYFNADDELLSTFPREGSDLATSLDVIGNDWITEDGKEIDGRRESILATITDNKVELSDGTFPIIRENVRGQDLFLLGNVV